MIFAKKQYAKFFKNFVFLQIQKIRYEFVRKYYQDFL